MSFELVDCASKRMLNNQSKDGHYMFHVAGSGGKNIKLLIYCNNMGTETPKEYLTLPSGPGGNFIRGNDKSGKHCLGRNGEFYLFYPNRICFTRHHPFPFIGSLSYMSLGLLGMSQL